MIRWDLLGPPPDIAGSFQQGVKLGEAFVTRKRTEAALGAYLQNPDDQGALSALAATDPDMAYRYVKLNGEQAELRQKAETRAATQRIGQRFATDQKGAVNEAIAGGQFDLAKTLQGLDPKDGKKVADYYKIAAPMAYKMRQMTDPAQRLAFFAQAKPILLDNGADPDALANFDPTNDTQLDAFIAQGQSVNDLISQGKITWHQQGEAPSFATDAMGRPVGSQNPYRGVVGQAPTTPAVTMGTIKAPAYAQQTSGYRTPAHNRDVGGVANSYHTKRDAAGNPLARDFVPSGGQSMAQLEADLRAQNPGMDVINEGDHVHVEPGNSAPARRGPVQFASKADFDAAPSGTEFIAPDGTHRRKP